MPLLWAIRDIIGLTGTKFGCGKGLCGACTVHIDGTPTRSCITPVSIVNGKSITTIEGLAIGDRLHPVQQAWIDEDVPQCGYCQSGQIMGAVAFLKKYPDPSDEEIRQCVTSLCRCGTYLRIFSAIKRAAQNNKADLLRGPYCLYLTSAIPPKADVRAGSYLTPPARLNTVQ